MSLLLVVAQRFVATGRSSIKKIHTQLFPILTYSKHLTLRKLGFRSKNQIGCLFNGAAKDANILALLSLLPTAVRKLPRNAASRATPSCDKGLSSRKSRRPHSVPQATAPGTVRPPQGRATFALAGVAGPSPHPTPARTDISLAFEELQQVARGRRQSVLHARPQLTVCKLPSESRGPGALCAQHETSGAGPPRSQPATLSLGAPEAHPVARCPQPVHGILLKAQTNPLQEFMISFYHFGSIQSQLNTPLSSSAVASRELALMARTQRQAQAAEHSREDGTRTGAGRGLPALCNFTLLAPWLESQNLISDLGFNTSQRQRGPKIGKNRLQTYSPLLCDWLRF